LYDSIEMKKQTKLKMKIKLIIFDMDGTIVDVPYDWKKIKYDLNTGGKPILPYLKGLKEPEKTKKWKVLEKYEQIATQRAELKDGIKDFIEFVQERKIKTSLVTNNSRKNVVFLLEKFKLSFDLVISRESGLWKPSADPFIEVLKRFAFNNAECCVVGDSFFDILAAEAAGIDKVFILGNKENQIESNAADRVGSYKELKQKIIPLIINP